MLFYFVKFQDDVKVEDTRPTESNTEAPAAEAEEVTTPTDGVTPTSPDSATSPDSKDPKKKDKVSLSWLLQL